jgi:hypothetical protein
MPSPFHSRSERILSRASRGGPLARSLWLRLDINGLGRPTVQTVRASTPLWIWITAGLVALGTLAYFGGVYLAKNVLTGF